MEIRYKRTHTPGRGKRYTAGEIGAMLGYAMEIADPRVRMEDGKLNPGEVCMLLFAISPEEYALKDADDKQMDALADRLLKNVPADRLLGWRILDLKGTLVQRTVKPRTGESIDNGEFARRMQEKLRSTDVGPLDAQLLECRRLQKLSAEKDAPEGVKKDWQAARRALGEKLTGLAKVYVAYEALLNDRFPSIGFDGKIEIFTTAQRAERIARQLSAMHTGLNLWNIRAFSGIELAAFFKTCAGDGLEHLRVDNGFAAVDLNVRDVIACENQPNAQLRSMMLRESEYGVRWNKYKEINAPEKIQRGALESMLTLRGFSWREIGKAKLYALCPGGNRDRCVVVGGKDGEGAKFLAVFTHPDRAKAFGQKLNDSVRPVEMRFDELAPRSAACEGMLIDIGFIAYRLLKSDYDRVLEARSKPPVIVRVKDDAAPAKSAEAAKPVETGLPDPDEFAPAGERGLPDPDHFAPPASTEKETICETGGEKESAEENAPRKGLLKLLFGKKDK